MEQGKTRGGAAEVIGVVALLVLAFGGYVKGSKYLAWAPVDITVLAAFVVAVLVVAQLTNRAARLQHLPLLALLLLAWTPGLMHTGVPYNAYAQQKPVQVFVLVPLCILGGAFLLRTPRARRAWVLAVGVFGLAVYLLAKVDPSADAGERLATAGGNTIGAGRGTGAAAVVFVVLAIAARRHRWWYVAGAVVAALGALGAASRGPLVAAAVAVLVAVMLPGARGRFGRILTLVVGVFLAAVWFARSGQAVNARVLELTDKSAEMRRTLWSIETPMIKHHPAGFGWGRLYDQLGFSLLDSGYTQYPHNVLLEVTSEAGWVAGIMLVVVCAVAFRDQLRRATRPVEMVLLGLMVFAFVNALVSGDINANRGVWVAIGTAFAAQITTGRTRATDTVVSAGSVTASRSANRLRLQPNHFRRRAELSPSRQP